MPTAQAIVFDIGRVIEITPDLGVTAQWQQRLNLASGDLDRWDSVAFSNIFLGSNFFLLSIRVDAHPPAT